MGNEEEEGTYGMKNPPYPGILAGLALAFFCVACRPLAPAETQTEPTPLAATAVPSQSATPVAPPLTIPSATGTPMLSLNEFVDSLSTPTPKFAPYCEPVGAFVFTPTPNTPDECQGPIAEQSSSYCANKSPYNLILVNQGSTYEVSSEKIVCSDAGSKDGKQLVTCTGPMAFSYELTVCDQACGIRAFPPGSTDCPQDFSYNERLRCCGQKEYPEEANCVVLKLQTRTCMIDCSQYTDQATCEKNAYACKWDDVYNLCNLKKQK